MYLDFYQLREQPFGLTSDPRFLYFSAGHREAMAGLLYCLRERKGASLLLGDPGTGKTTVLAAVAEMLPGGVRLQWLDSPLHASPVEALAGILRGFEIPAGGSSLSAMLADLQNYLAERHARGECVLLVIDEAQDLNPLVLEQVRLLTNLELGGHKLLQIILSGQPELAVHLRNANGRALHQRIAVRCRLEPLSRQETGAYITARLQRAGTEQPLFEEAAVDRIHHLSRGVPRLINIIADHSLLAGFAAQAPRITAALVRRIETQLDLPEEAAPSTAAAAPRPQPAVAAAPSTQRPPALQRFATGWARWSKLAEGGE